MDIDMCWIIVCFFTRKRCRNKDRKSTRLNSSHGYISYAVFCLKKKKKDVVHPVVRRRRPAVEAEQPRAAVAPQRPQTHTQQPVESRPRAQRRTPLGSSP